MAAAQPSGVRWRLLVIGLCLIGLGLALGFAFLVLVTHPIALPQGGCCAIGVPPTATPEAEPTPSPAPPTPTLAPGQPTATPAPVPTAIPVTSPVPSPPRGGGGLPFNPLAVIGAFAAVGVTTVSTVSGCVSVVRFGWDIVGAVRRRRLRRQAKKVARTRGTTGR
jgi:hypothetical protein